MSKSAYLEESITAVVLTRLQSEFQETYNYLESPNVCTLSTSRMIITMDLQLMQSKYIEVLIITMCFAVGARFVLPKLYIRRLFSICAK